MQRGSVERLGDTTIQLVFRDRKASVLLSGNVTLEHVASTLNEVSKHYVERPRAVYVMMKRPDC